MAQDTYSGLLARLADNTDGDISALDMRTIVESLRPSHGSIALRTPAETTISAANTFVISAGVTALDTHYSNFSMPASFTLRYTGTVPVVAYCCATCSMRSASANRLSLLRFAINGDVTGQEAVDSEIERYIAASDAGAVSIRAQFALQPNDEVALFIANGTAATNMTITRCTMQAQAYVL
jgi:hypothetical protein